ncbi:hypothetical protein GN244_ATG02823 [Phytophthora infestans]|uniref:Ankyrin repeat protein n=1 Tax=Phytophthora infestans TaxID=4787 RepID=A0A833TQQ7_PHYIN|nr:hypothetical protein GN244_ATG02823 [Phytophthora infestans]
MEHPRREDSAYDYNLRRRKRLKHATLPRSICAVPHVMRRIDLFAMSLEDAAIEAAATNDIGWLQSVLAQIEIDAYRDDVGCDGIDIAAANGSVEILKAIYRWWIKDNYAPTRLCKRALINAVNGGHLEAVRALLTGWHWKKLVESRSDDENVETPYKFDLLEALEAAVNKGDYKMTRVICEYTTIRGNFFLWAAEHDNLTVFENVFYFHHFNDMENLYRAMLVAVSRGCLDIVRSVIENAIKHNQRDVVDYLYAHDSGCEDDTHAAAFCAAAAYGSLEMVEMMYDKDKENFDASTLEKAFASAAGNNQLVTMTHLQTIQTFGHAAMDQAFVEASRNGKMDAVKYVGGIEGYNTSAFALGEALEGAASGGHLEVLKFLDTKANLPRIVVTNAFANVIKDIEVLSDARSDQVRILKFLHSREKVYPDVIEELFPQAASCCSLVVVEFLYSTGFISTESLNEAFYNAATDNCVQVVRFLYSTLASLVKSRLRKFS